MNRIPAVTSTLSTARKFCSVSQNAVCGAVRQCGGDILGRGRVAQVRTLRAARRKARDAQTCERSRARAYLGESLSEAIITAEKALPPLVQRTVPLNNNIGTSVICPASSPTFFR